MAHLEYQSLALSHDELLGNVAALTDKERQEVKWLLAQRNQIERFPVFICTQLPNLTRLNLNCLELPDDACAVPECITELRALKVLFLECCSLTELPPSLNTMTRLEALFIADNSFRTLPNLKPLKRLESLWLSQDEEYVREGVAPMPDQLKRDFGDADWLDTASRGGTVKVSKHVDLCERYYSSGVRAAVVTVLAIGRWWKGSVLGLLPRDLLVMLCRDYLWSSRFDPVWEPACRRVFRWKPRKQNASKKGLGKNKKIKKKKERKEGSGLKGYVM